MRQRDGRGRGKQNTFCAATSVNYLLLVEICASVPSFMKDILAIFIQLSQPVALSLANEQGLASAMVIPASS